MKRVILIDSHALIHRAYHALPRLTGPDGNLVNAVYGFSSVLLKMLRELKPDYAAAAFDLAAPTFRHAAFTAYKATRVKAPDELYAQIPAVREILKAFGIPAIEKEGYEADDIIGTLAKRLEALHPDLEVIIVTGDLDTLQLVSPRTKVFTLRKGITDTVLYDEKAVQARYGLKPGKLADFKGLAGDASDNIPGVKGVGEKTASELLKRFGTVESLYEAVRKKGLKISPAVLNKLAGQEEMARLSKELATIHKDVPVRVSLEDMNLEVGERRGRVEEVFTKFGFQSLIKRMADSEGPPTKNQGAGSQSLRSPIKAVGVDSLAGVPAAESIAVVLSKERSLAFLAAPGGKVFELAAAVLAGDDGRGWMNKIRKFYVFDLKFLLKSGLVLPDSRTCDLFLCWHLLNPGRRNYDRNDLLSREFRLDKEPDPAWAAALLLELGPTMESRLKAAQLDSVYSDLESPLTRILSDMENIGIGLDSAPLVRLSKKMSEKLAGLKQKIYEFSTIQFNINSPQQLAEILFKKLGLSQKGIRKTEKSGRLSTRESELVKLRGLHPIIGNILDWRELAKLKSTYVDALPQLVAGDGRIHTTWNQTSTATGRLSSQNPNLQNIPIRSKYGREIRSAFVAEKGFSLAAFDYSQLELRVAARLARDEKMIDAFRQGLDIHTLTAAEVNNIAMERVTPELRHQAKALNFGVLYGMGSRAFAEAAGVSRVEAETFIKEYFNDFKAIATFIASVKESARDTGYTETAFGRKRFFPEIVSTNARLKGEAERQAVNHPIQGTAADIVKKAMIEADHLIELKNWRDKVRMLLQIHDELIFEVKNNMLDSVLPEIASVMEGIWPGDVIMKIEFKHGANWGQLE